MNVLKHIFILLLFSVFCVKPISRVLISTQSLPIPSEKMIDDDREILSDDEDLKFFTFEPSEINDVVFFDLEMPYALFEELFCQVNQDSLKEKGIYIFRNEDADGNIVSFYIHIDVFDYSISLEVVFPGDFPNHPLLIRIINPKINMKFLNPNFKISENGSILSPYYTPLLWSPAVSLDELLLSLRDNLFELIRTSYIVIKNGDYDNSLWLEDFFLYWKTFGFEFDKGLYTP